MIPHRYQPLRPGVDAGYPEAVGADRRGAVAFDDFRLAVATSSGGRTVEAMMGQPSGGHCRPPQGEPITVAPPDLAPLPKSGQRRGLDPLLEGTGVGHDLVECGPVSRCQCPAKPRRQVALARALEHLLGKQVSQCPPHDRAGPPLAQLLVSGQAQAELHEGPVEKGVAPLDADGDVDSVGLASRA